MIAVGCDSVAPKVPGADLPSVFYLKTMEDGLLLREIAHLRMCGMWRWWAAGTSAWK